MSGAIQASGMLALSAPVASLVMMWSSGLILLTLVAAVCYDGTGRSLRSHHSSLFSMVGGLSPAKMSRQQPKMWPSSVVLLAQGKGSVSFPNKNLMWRVGCVTMMRRAGRSCRGKNVRVLILTTFGEISFSFRSKMAGYAVKAFSWRCLLNVSDNVVAYCCVRRGWGEIAGSSLFCTVLGPLVVGGLVGGTSWGTTLLVLTFSQRIDPPSPVVSAGTVEGCGSVGVTPVLAAAIPWRLSLSF